MNKYKELSSMGGGVERSLIDFDLQRFAEVENPYNINSIDKNYIADTELKKNLVDLSYYAKNNIPDYDTITEIPQENIEYLNSGLVADNIEYMFDGCSMLQSIPKLNIDTSNCTSTKHTFSGLYELTSLDVSWLNTDNVTDMSYMFSYIGSRISTGINIFGLNNMNTTKCTNMYYMFAYSNLIGELDLSNWNTYNVTDMYCLFAYCDLLTLIDISNFNTSNVTDMQSMFFYCTNLKEIKGIIDMKSCRNMIYMFRNTSNVSNVKIMNKPANFELLTELKSDQYEIVS